MNVLFLALILSATAVSAMAELSGQTGALSLLTESTLKAAQDSITLLLTLAATMAVFMGVLRIAETAGIMPMLARPLMPLLRKLFPRDPGAWDAIGLNVGANLLGMGNAATPFGIKAMNRLEESNPRKGIASDAQITFLALNTAGITLLPAKVIALRASLGSADPAAIVGPTLAASLCALLAGLAAAHILGQKNDKPTATAGIAWMLPILVVALLAAVMVTMGPKIGPWLLPVLIAGLVLWGFVRRVPVYQGFVDGAKDGLLVTGRIAPYLLTILVAIGMARGSGALDMMTAPVGRLLEPLGLPPQALILAIVRTLSGSGAFGLLASSLGQTDSGPDSPLGILLSTIYGSTETTFYVVAVYFGAVGTHSLRHAIAVGLIADCAGLMAATLICKLAYG